MVFDAMYRILASMQLVARDAAPLAGATKTHHEVTTATADAVLFDIDHFSVRNFFVVDEFVEAYFLEPFVGFLAKYVSQWEHVWGSLDSFTLDLADQLTHFLSSALYNSKLLTHHVFSTLQPVALKWWRGDADLALLLEEFCFHRCAFGIDDLHGLLDQVLHALDIPEDPDAPLDHLNSSATSRLLPLLAAIVRVVDLEDKYEPDLYNQMFAGELDEDCALVDLTDHLLFALTRMAKYIEGDRTQPDHLREVSYSGPVFFFVMKALWEYLNNNSIDILLRKELRVVLQENWDGNFLSLLVRRSDCPINVRTMVVKIYYDLHTFDDFQLISRCFVRSLAGGEGSSKGHQGKEVQPPQLIPDSAKSGEEEESKQDLAGEEADRATLSSDVSLPVFMHYMNDSLYVVGKAVIFYFLLQLPAHERRSCFNERHSSVVSAIIDQKAAYLQKASYRSAAIPQDTEADYADIMSFFRADDFFLDVPDKDFRMHRSLPALFSAAFFFKFVQKYLDVKLVYNTYLHHTMAKQLLWLATFTVLLIEDHKDIRLAPMQRVHLDAALISMRSIIETCLAWSLHSRSYITALIQPDTVSAWLLQPSTASTSRAEKQKMAAMPVAVLRYYREVCFASESLMFKEVSRIVARLSRQFTNYEGSAKAKAAAVARKNDIVLNLLESLALRNLFNYLGRYARPDHSTYSLLTVINALFQPYDSTLCSDEQVSEYYMRILQYALDFLGLTDCLVALINRLIGEHKQENDFVTQILSLCIQLSSNLMYEGNAKVQNHFLLLAGYDVDTKVYSKSGSGLLASVKQLLAQTLSTSLEVVIEPYQVSDYT